jgi:glutamyl-tRNA(Gln) amidotransferase subunit D
MPWHWINLANEVAKELNSGAIGAIVTHGTDYLHYSSAALSFMLGVGKPVAFVGAQRSPDRGGFDGAMNLMCAAHYCASNYGEVALVMHGTTNDDYCLAHRGTKVRKMHSSRRDAFKSVNDEPLAKITKDGKLERINQRIAARNDSQVVADAVFEKKTYLLKSFPGAPSGLLDYVIDKGAKGIVIEGSGLGHVCTGEGGINPGFNFKEYSWIPGIKRATEAGIVVAMTTQTIFGKVNPFVYRNLRLASGAGAVYCSDLHAESAFVKLGWLLGHDYGPEKTRNLLLKDFAGEFNPRLALENGD